MRAPRVERVGFALLLALLCLVPPRLLARPADLPARLSDDAFWQLIDALSEPDGVFKSDNLLSNELALARLVPELVAKTLPGGVYLGVGPEQNFSYIAAMRPALAFVLDIRRGNLLLHLMYKALFSLSSDRAEFVSRLFTRPVPPGLGAAPAADTLMAAVARVRRGPYELYQRNLAAIVDELVRVHGFALSPDDLDGISYIYHCFYSYGPSINWGTTSTGLVGGQATYADMMQQGGWSYLASNESFEYVKDLEARNLIVPVVGDFAGVKALRAIGAYVRDLGATVTAFYVSNVEMYLRGVYGAFCANVAALPLDDDSVFIRPNFAIGLGFQVSPGAPTVSVANDRAHFAGSTLVYRQDDYVRPPGVTLMAPELKGCGYNGGGRK